MLNACSTDNEVNSVSSEEVLIASEDEPLPPRPGKVNIKDAFRRGAGGDYNNNS